MSIFIQIHILKGTLFRNWTLSRCDELGVMMKSVPLSSFGFPEVAEIIIFFGGNSNSRWPEIWRTKHIYPWC